MPFFCGPFDGLVGRDCTAALLRGRGGPGRPAEGNLKDAEDTLRIAQSKLDKAAQKGVLHKNTVSRRKAQLAAKVGSIKS